MNVAEQAQQLAAAGRVVDAARLLEGGVERGDALAAATLANWRLSGSLIRRDLAVARDLFGQAAGLGLNQAEPVYTALLANGAGGIGRRWDDALERLRNNAVADRHAAEQLGLVAAMDLDGDGKPGTCPAGELLASDPEVRRFPGFLSAQECGYLIERAMPLLKPAVVVHPGTGAFIQDPVRSSTAAFFPFALETPVLHAINQRIAAATGTTYEQGEPLQVLSYEPGQQYKMHSDALAGDPNQRVVTFLVYLNDAYEGGETIFPDLDLRYRGDVGDGLMFRNVQSDGTPHPLARHAGLPVTRGRKLLLSKWIRARALDLSGPPGRPL